MTTTRLFLALMILGPVHLGEQLLTSVEELDLFKGLVADYYAAFSWLDSDRATVVLIMIVFTLFSYLVFGVLAGGIQRLAVLALFGLLGIGESHHLIESVRTLDYDAGLITAIPYVVLGSLLVVAVRRELRSIQHARKDVRALAVQR